MKVIPPYPGKVHQRKLPVRKGTVQEKGPLDLSVPPRPGIVFHLQVIPPGLFSLKIPLDDCFLTRQHRDSIPSFSLCLQQRSVLSAFLRVPDGIRSLQDDLLFRPDRRSMGRAVFRIGGNVRVYGISAHLVLILPDTQIGGSHRRAGCQRQQHRQHNSRFLSHLFFPPVHSHAADSVSVRRAEIGQILPGHDPRVRIGLPDHIRFCILL